VRTTVDIPEVLLRSARRQAAERHVTLSAVVADALRADLAKRPLADAPPFRLFTVKGRLVQPDLDLDRTSALFALDDEAEFGRASAGASRPGQRKRRTG